MLRRLQNIQAGSTEISLADSLFAQFGFGSQMESHTGLLPALG